MPIIAMSNIYLCQTFMPIIAMPTFICVKHLFVSNIYAHHCRVKHLCATASSPQNLSSPYHFVKKNQSTPLGWLIQSKCNRLVQSKQSKVSQSRFMTDLPKLLAKVAVVWAQSYGAQSCNSAITPPPTPLAHKISTV